MDRGPAVGRTQGTPSGLAARAGCPGRRAQADPRHSVGQVGPARAPPSLRRPGKTAGCQCAKQRQADASYCSTNKNSAPQARRPLWSNHFETGGDPWTHAFWPPKQRHNHPHTPSGLTRPTRPVDHPTGPLRPSTPPGPLPWAPLGLGLIRLRAWAPPGPLRFLVFVFLFFFWLQIQET